MVNNVQLIFDNAAVTMLGKNYQRPDSGPLVQLPRLKVNASGPLSAR